MTQRGDSPRQSYYSVDRPTNRPASETDTFELVEGVPKARSRSNTSRVLTGGGSERFGDPSSSRSANRYYRTGRRTASSKGPTDPALLTDSRTNTERSNGSTQEQAPVVATTGVHESTEKDGGTIMQRLLTSKDDNNIDTESIRSEDTLISRRDLGTFDVAALIINKQIGTGIFTTPGLVLSLAGSKSASIAMWVCGGIWAFLSVIIYVEFGAAFPFNGGELIYVGINLLDEVFRRPELLTTVLFSAFFITIPNTAGNSIQFAKHVLLAAEPNVTNTQEFDKRLLSYIAVSVLTVILLVVTFIAGGFYASTQSNNGKHDWGVHNSSGASGGSTSAKNVIAGMIYVIYSYQGWENANYVGGELKVARSSLKRGAFLAVGLVTILYSLVAWAYYYALSYEELVNNDLAVIVNFVPKAFGHTGVLPAKICIALSAFGNLIAVVYTSAKVKQQIARQCIIPFYKFFAAEDATLRTPYGALILHWVFAVLWVVCMPNTSSGYGFVIGLFIYGQLAVGVFVSFAFFFLRRSYETGLTRNSAYNSVVAVWKPVILKNRVLRLICAVLFMVMNILVLVEASRVRSSPPSWVKPTVLFGLLSLVTVFWAGLRLIAKKSGPESSIEVRIIRDGLEEPSEKDEPVLQKAKLEGNSRVVIYEVHGRLEKRLTKLDFYFHKTIRFLSR